LQKDKFFYFYLVTNMAAGFFGKLKKFGKKFMDSFIPITAKIDKAVSPCIDKDSDFGKQWHAAVPYVDKVDGATRVVSKILTDENVFDTDDSDDNPYAPRYNLRRKTFESGRSQTGWKLPPSKEIKLRSKRLPPVKYIRRN
jgi:hypothetical protein